MPNKNYVRNQFLALAIPQKLVLLTVPCSALVFSPTQSLDSFSLPKFSAVLLLVGILTSYVILSKTNFASLPKSLLFLTFYFFVSLLLPLLISGANSTNQLFGAFGRNNGFISMVFLIMLFFYCAFMSDKIIIKTFLFVILVSGHLTSFYAVLQILNIDFFDWQNSNKFIFGTFGNPNFLSAYLGISATLLYLNLISINSKLSLRFICAVNIIVMLIIVFISNSIQGFFIFGVGATIASYFRFFAYGAKRKLRYYFSFAIALIVVYTSFGAAQMGPLGSIIYQDSIIYRIDYWKSGIKMALNNPINGVGLDNFASWYPFFRDSEAASRRIENVITNSAHNLPIDFAAMAGFPLLIAYLGIIFKTGTSAVRMIRVEKQYNQEKIALFAVWLISFLQSLASVNNLPVATIFWISSGLIIGIVNSNRTKSSNKVVWQNLSFARIVISILIFFLSFLLATLPINKDRDFLHAIKNRDALALLRSADSWPKNDFYYEYASLILLESKSYELSKSAARKALQINPRNINAITYIIANPTSNIYEIQKLKLLRKSIDPYWLYPN